MRITEFEFAFIIGFGIVPMWQDWRAFTVIIPFCIISVERK